jgi:hypothetical protein
MITKLNISLTWINTDPLPDLPAGVHTMAEIMPAVLAAHGLDAERPIAASTATDFDLMMAVLESALSIGITIERP